MCSLVPGDLLLVQLVPPSSATAYLNFLINRVIIQKHVVLLTEPGEHLHHVIIVT